MSAKQEIYKPRVTFLFGLLAPTATVLIWSANTVVTKAAAGAISPASISFYRWLLAFMVLLPFVAPGLWRLRREVALHWWKLAILGLLGMAIFQSLAYEAARTTSALNMGVMIALMPLMSAFLASLLASEKLTAAKTAGGILSLVGLVYLTSQGDPARMLETGPTTGDLLMLLAVFANSLYGVLLKRWTIPLPNWHKLCCQIGFATLCLLPVWLAGPASPITATNLPMILFAALPTSLLAPYFWMVSVQRLGAARSALFVNLLPIFVAAMAWAFLSEELRSYHAIGGSLALVGVAMGLRKPRLRHNGVTRPDAA